MEDITFRRFVELLDKKTNIPDNVIGIVTLIIDSVEEISNREKAAGVVFSGHKKLDLALRISQRVIDYLSETKKISPELADQITEHFKNTDMYVNTINTLVAIIKEHAVPAIKAIRNCCCRPKKN